MMNATFYAQDHYVYYETDIIDSIHFLTKGTAGYVLPIRKNIVFVEIEKGDDFGQVCIVSASIEREAPIEELL